MCNLYSVTKGQAAIRELARAMRDTTGNLPPLPGIFPDYPAPIVRTGADGVRELVMARCGMPSPAFALQGKKVDKGVTNIRNLGLPHWRRWTGPASRCVVPFTSFSENAKGADSKAVPVWFAFDESRPLAVFAGLWTSWTGTRKIVEGKLACDLYGFLTTAPNLEVGAVHPKAMPVILTEPDEIELWLTAPWREARALQRPLPDGALQVVAPGRTGPSLLPDAGVVGTFALVAALVVAAATELRGEARVHDGDTLMLAGEDVRLLDVDAPELAQLCEDGLKELAACGELVAAALQRKLAGATVTCIGEERDDWDRLLVHCRVGGEDLSTWLVEQGYGMAFRRYSTRLVAAEEQAKADRRGLWRTTFEPPWAFRARRWAKAGSKAPGGCAIKGNVSRKGERIYHTPWGDRFYERTRIDERKGERWFCSEKEAADAGFRAPLLR